MIHDHGITSRDPPEMVSRRMDMPPASSGSHLDDRHDGRRGIIAIGQIGATKSPDPADGSIGGLSGFDSFRSVRTTIPFSPNGGGERSFPMCTRSSTDTIGETDQVISRVSTRRIMGLTSIRYSTVFSTRTL